MNKKNYIKPNTEVVMINVQSHILGNSITGASMEGDFSEGFSVGGTTTSSDSRGGGYWDDED